VTAPGRVHLFVLIDALGWRVIEGRDFLSDVLPHRQPLRTVLGYSSGAIPTLLTGRTPAEHGHWNLFYYDPENSPFAWLRPLCRLPRPLLENRLTRRALKEWGRRFGLGPLFDCSVSPRLLPLLNWVEKRSIYERGGISGAPSIFDDLAAAGAETHVYSYHRGRDADLLLAARRDLASGAGGFYFVYLSEVDALLHLHCDDPSVVQSRLGWYADQLRDLFAVARERDPEAALTIFSDHGMTPVRHHCDLVARLEALDVAMPEDYLAVYDSTMARFWFFNERARREVTAALRGVTGGRVCEDAELEALGVLFPDRRYGELIFLVEPGWLVAGSGFNGSSWRPTGMHGYHPDDAHSDGVFLSDRPPSRPVRTVADVHVHLREAVPA
jgi:hypothetical protein